MNYPTRPGSSVILDLPDEAYHALPELSSSQAKALLESPARFNYWRGKRRPEKKSFDIGHAVHAKVLGKGMGVVELHYDNYRTKAAQEERDAAYAEGKTPLLKKELRPIEEMAESALAHPLARKLLEVPGQSEVSIVTTDPETGCPVRARFDRLPYPGEGLTKALDVKTTAGSASAESFARAAFEYGYYIQRSWYLDCLKWATGDEAEMLFLVIETEPPYLPAVHQMDPVFVEMGDTAARYAREKFLEYTAANHWPGHPEEAGLITPPTWAAIQHDEKYAIEEMRV
jgi:hypothetical protein